MKGFSEEILPLLLLSYSMHPTNSHGLLTTKYVKDRRAEGNNWRSEQLNQKHVSN